MAQPPIKSDVSYAVPVVFVEAGAASAPDAPALAAGPSVDGRHHLPLRTAAFDTKATDGVTQAWVNHRGDAIRTVMSVCWPALAGHD